jgi:hypothetical protein
MRRGSACPTLSMAARGSRGVGPAQENPMRPLMIFAATAAFVFSAGVPSSPANAKTYSVKYLGSKALAGTCARGGGTFHQSTAVSHSCTYKNGNVRDCSSKSKQCVVITGGKARVQQATGVGGVPAGGGAVYATTTIECGSKKYEVSTGNKSGTCLPATDGKSVTCDDKKNSYASANCSTGCGGTSGSGSCTVKDRTAGPPSGPRPRGKPGVAVIPPVGGSILDSGPGFGNQGPAVTGAPLSTGRGSAPPPGKIN